MGAESAMYRFFAILFRKDLERISKPVFLEGWLAAERSDAPDCRAAGAPLRSATSHPATKMGFEMCTTYPGTKTTCRAVPASTFCRDDEAARRATKGIAVWDMT